VELVDILGRLARERGLAGVRIQGPEPLAGLEYEVERRLKQDALALFWKEHALAGRLEDLVPTPQPRAYRSTSKRAAEAGRRGLALSAGSALDRAEHTAVYEFLVPALARPPAAALGASLNYAIVRGTETALTLILNVRVFDARVVRAAKQIAERIGEARLGVRAAFLYLDPTASDYYLEAKRPAGTLSWKRLFGPEWLEVSVDGARLRFPPTVFSQVSDAMLPVMTAAASRLLALDGDRDLLDLYCGYGLFSLTLGRAAAQVTGVDHDGPAIEAARANAPHVKGLPPARFLAGRVTEAFVRTRLRRASAASERVLLDPPRQGTEPGVVAAIADRRPDRVLHVCCGADEIPREVAAWSRAGYRVERAVPLDMFAGTPGLEVLLLLERPDAPPLKRRA
jgi:tRNA/tmRNA/rRNA uracil-C5-methylase (TrmA/RlmC/RlmD family)